MSGDKALLLCSALTAMLFSPAAFSHSVGTSYITVGTSNAPTLTARVDLTLRDLEFAVGLDRNDDGLVTWREVIANTPTIANYVQQNLTIARGGQHCAMAATDLAIDRHADEVYAVLMSTVSCPAKGVIDIHSNLMFALDDSHRTLLTVTTDSFDTVTVLTANDRAWTETQASWSIRGALVRFVGQGIWHIWTGFDHLAFLLLLLLPLARTGRQVERVRDILKVVTAFTAAHSITLACAALGYVNLASRWTEAAIAATIVIAATANLVNRADRFGVAMAFGFGLIHGLGFASALADITTNTTQRVLPLIGFNVGVELGQLVVVAVVFPFLFAHNTSMQFRRRSVAVGSAIMGALGVAWLVQRTILF